MTVKYDAPFAQSKKTGRAVVTAAKTTYNDAANAVLLFTAGADGSLVRRITAVPRATVTATQLQLYRSSDGGTTLDLCNSALMAAYTMAQTTAVPVTDFGLTFTEPMGLAPLERLYVGMGNALAGGVVFTAEGEDF